MLPKIFEDRYEWCDVYGMVNPTTEQVAQYDKLVAIGPEFGVTLGSRFSNYYLLFKTISQGA